MYIYKKKKKDINYLKIRYANIYTGDYLYLDLLATCMILSSRYTEIRTLITFIFFYIIFNLFAVSNLIFYSGTKQN